MHADVREEIQEIFNSICVLHLRSSSSSVVEKTLTLRLPVSAFQFSGLLFVWELAVEA